MVKVEVWKCAEHGEFEVTFTSEGVAAYCPRCGKPMTKVGGYDE